MGIVTRGGLTDKKPQTWRWRKCPGCGQVAAASRFAVAQTYCPGWQSGAMLRSCPACGRTGPTGSFPVVREAHPSPAGSA